jgi:hypothetical protein
MASGWIAALWEGPVFVCGIASAWDQSKAPNPR